MTSGLAVTVSGPSIAGGAIAVAVAIIGAAGRARLGSPIGRITAADSTNRRAPRARPRVRVRLTATTAIGLAAFGAILVGPFVIGIVATAAVTWRLLRPVVEDRRHRRRAERELPDAIERLVLLVHAGLTPHQAVRAAGRSVLPAVRPGFDEVVHRLDRSMPLGDALDGLTDVLGPRAAGVADAFGAADRYGLPLEPMLDQLARDARADRRRLDEADARRLPVRLTFPLVTCTLPSFVLVAIAPAVLAAISSLGGSTW